MAYSDVEKAEALIRLAVNRYDLDRTARETGVSRSSLKRWLKNEPKKSVFELLERAIERLLMNIPTAMTGQEWAIALGILLDKWLLAQGEPTSRAETIERRIGDLSDDEYDQLLSQARSILDEATGGGAAA